MGASKLLDPIRPTYPAVDLRSNPFTFPTAHAPPRRVLISRAVNSAAIARSDACPWARMSASTGKVRREGRSVLRHDRPQRSTALPCPPEAFRPIRVAQLHAPRLRHRQRVLRPPRDCLPLGLGHQRGIGDVTDFDDPDRKDRIASLKATRDQSRVDVDRTSAMLESAGQKAITAPMLAKFAQTARQRMHLSGGGYC